MKKIEGKLYIIYTYIFGLPYIFLGKYMGRHYLTGGQEYNVEVDLIRKENEKIIDVSAKDVYELNRFCYENFSKKQKRKIIKYIMVRNLIR